MTRRRFKWNPGPPVNGGHLPMFDFWGVPIVLVSDGDGYRRARRRFGYNARPSRHRRAADQQSARLHLARLAAEADPF